MMFIDSVLAGLNPACFSGSMNGFLGGICVLSPEVCQLLGYWWSLGGGEKVPERNLLNLRHLTPILPWMYILEMSADGSLRYRLAGSSLEEAIGRGMAGETYCNVFAATEQAAIMEELYAVSLVQSSGILRTGSFKLNSKNRFDLEVLSLPFQDPRAMGGTILVGVVRPFEYQNQGFVDKWGEFDQRVESILSIPSPRVVTANQLTSRVCDLLINFDIDLRAMDLKKVMEIDDRGLHHKYKEVPSISLDGFDQEHSSSLN